MPTERAKTVYNAPFLLIRRYVCAFFSLLLLCISSSLFSIFSAFCFVYAFFYIIFLKNCFIFYLSSLHT